MGDDKNRLITLLAERAFKYSEEPVFKLASGKSSNYYVNCKMVTLEPEGLNLIGGIVNDMIRENFLKDGIIAVGGLTLGADPIAVSSSLISYQRGAPLKAFVIRKEPKRHGLKKWVEGDVKEGDSVIILEDVITTGMSTLKAIERAKEGGLHVKGVIALVDREEGGVENIKRDHDLNVLSIAKKSELLIEYKAKN
jgi:orotate phosphoribosyltransferase